MEILFTNRRKEKLSADSVSLVEAPGWVILKNDGVVAEIISASVIKRIRFVPAVQQEQVAPAPAASLPMPERPANPPLPPPPGHLLRLPLRPVGTPARPQPLVPSRRFV